MNFDRRDFLRTGTAGLAGGLLGLESTFGQETPNDEHKDEHAKSDTVVEFRGGTGSLHLVLKLEKIKTPGTLDLYLDNFDLGRDRTLVASGTFEPVGRSAVRLYRSYFCVDDANQVFARLGDDHHWTSVMLSRTDDSKIESLTVWNDTTAPASFRIDKDKFKAEVARSKGNPSPVNYVLDGQGKTLDLKGTRTPPEITVEALENALDNNPEYLAFMRGKTRMRQHAQAMQFDCFFIVMAVPGGAIYDVCWEGLF